MEALLGMDWPDIVTVVIASLALALACEALLTASKVDRQTKRVKKLFEVMQGYAQARTDEDAYKVAMDAVGEGLLDLTGADTNLLQGFYRMAIKTEDYEGAELLMSELLRRGVRT